MLPLMNIPILEHIVRLLRRHGFLDLVVLLYFQPQAIKDYFGDGSDWGVKITYVTPSEDLGTAGAVKAAQSYLDATFLIISGDLLTDMDLRVLVDFHMEKGACVTLGLVSVANPLQFGVVITGDDGCIVKFLEKPGWGEVFSDTINTGVYMLEPWVLGEISENSEFDFSKDLFPRLLAAGKPLFGYHSKGYWRDIGDPESYRQAHYDIFDGMVKVEVPGSKLDLVGRDVRVGNEVQVGEGVRFEGTVILGNNTRVGDRAFLRNCVLGSNCSLAPKTRVSDSVIWDNVLVEEAAQVEGAVICNNVRLGSGAIVGKGAVVAEGCEVGKDALVKEGIMIWPNKVLEEGAVLTDNLIWGEKWKKRLFESAVVTGITNMDLTPEFVAKLGVAYGSTLPKNASILTGRDSFRASRMLKRAFIGGVLSAGVHVKDLKLIPEPVLCYKLQSFGEVGGVVFRQSLGAPSMTEICFYDMEGLSISTFQEKGIERVFAREDFRRVHSSEPGGISEMPKVVDFYREGFFKSLDMDAIKESSFRIVVDFAHGPASTILPEMLGEMGCDVVGINAYLEERMVNEVKSLKDSLEGLSKIVVALNAHGGFRISPSGEQLIMVDEEGRVYQGTEALMGMVSLVLNTHSPGALVAPVAAPSVLEEAAVGKGFAFYRVPHGPRNVAEACRKGEVVMGSSLEGGFVFPKFHHVFDALFALAKALEMMARGGISLGQARKALPSGVFLHKEVPCPLELKGAIMRRLSQEAADKEVSFIDGIKIFSPSGAWILLLPDQVRPLFHLYAEAQVEKEASALLDEYQSLLEEWKRGGQGGGRG
jgi:mannose-1-phosphate guanylyltransferase/phosphomannomutase